MKKKIFNGKTFGRISFFYLMLVITIGIIFYYFGYDITKYQMFITAATILYGISWGGVASKNYMDKIKQKLPGNQDEN